MGISCDFARALAVVFQSIPVCNRPDECDSLQVTNLALDIVPSFHVYACQNFIQGLA